MDVKIYIYIDRYAYSNEAMVSEDCKTTNGMNSDVGYNNLLFFWRDPASIEQPNDILFEYDLIRYTTDRSRTEVPPTNQNVITQSSSLLEPF
jgi:hypothetical protein